MSSMTLKLEPLTQKIFEEFGDVISTDDSGGVELINYGLTQCHVRQSEIDTLDKNGATTMRLFDTEPIVLPYRLRIMERHPLGTQAFVNIDDNPYVLVVGKAGRFDLGNLKAFVARPDQSINYSKGTWHHHSLCLNARTRFVVIDRTGPGMNLEEKRIPENVELFVDF